MEITPRGRILVIEDDEEVQRLVARAAEADGFSVIQAFDGATGFELALTRSVDLVLLEIGTRVRGGRDVLSQLKQDARTAALPVLICSGRSDQRRVALELGAVDFIEKPFITRLLMNRIGQLVEQTRAIPAPTDHVTSDGRGAPADGLDRGAKPRPERQSFGSTLARAIFVGKKLADPHRGLAAVEAPPGRPLRVLIAEDTPDDALLIQRELASGGFAVAMERVQTRDAMKAALARQPFDLVVSDYTMPGFDALDALATLKETGIDLPFIVVSGTVEDAATALKAGAHDFVVKSKLGRLVPAVERELREAKSRAGPRSRDL